MLIVSKSLWAGLDGYTPMDGYTRIYVRFKSDQREMKFRIKLLRMNNCALKEQNSNQNANDFLDFLGWVE